MKNFEKPGSWKRYILPTLLLAGLCVGAVELLVCYYQAPEIYNAVTAPVRAAVQRAGELSELAWNGLRRRTDEVMTQGVSQVKAGLRHLDELLTWNPPQTEEPQDTVQLVDGGAVEPPPRTQASFSITALVSRNGREYLTGGSRDLVYFNQTAEAWAEEPYGTDVIGRYGCGPTAMAMVVSTLSGTETDPARMAQHCVDQGYWASRQGSYWSIVPGTAEDFGLTCTSLLPEETDADTILSCLSTGQLLVALMGPGHFTNSGHFIVLRGTTLDGSILVADPASVDRSLTTWDLELILDELSASRHDGAPLWILSRSLF